MRTLLPFLSVLLLPIATTTAQDLSDSTLNLVVARLADGATHSWELGTRAQALLELDAPLYSVFSSTTLPPPSSPPKPANVFPAANLSAVLGIAEDAVKKLNVSQAFVTQPQPQPLVAGDGSAGDPASLGVAVLLANWTQDQGGNSGSGKVDPNAFGAAAEGQLRFLLEKVPRTSDGAISHRVSQAQLWSDFTYMAPPFLAYYGAITKNSTLLREAYNQCKLYRDHLRDPNADNLWKHIVEGTDGLSDNGHWSTGNGWAAMGMLRVLSTMKNSQLSGDFKNEQTDLTNWVGEILEGMYKHLDDSGLFRNYADNATSFQDASSSALIAAATYRLATVTGSFKHLSLAEKVRNTLSNGQHIDSDGWLKPVVNPLAWGEAGEKSPEGQAFVVMMQASWKDWKAAGSPGNAAVSMKTVGAWGWVAVLGSVVLGGVMI